MKSREIWKKYKTHYKSIINCLQPIRARGLEGKKVYREDAIISIAGKDMDILIDTLPNSQRAFVAEFLIKNIKNAIDKATISTLKDISIPKQYFKLDQFVIQLLDQKVQGIPIACFDYFIKQRLSKNLLYDLDFCKEVIFHHPELITIFPMELRKDEYLLQTCITRNPKLIQFFTEEQKQNPINQYQVFRRLPKRAITSGEMFQKFFGITELDNEEIVWDSIIRDGSILEFCSQRLKDDENFVFRALLGTPLYLEYASDKAKDTESVVKYALSHNGYALQFASERLQSNREFVKIAVESKGYALVYADKKFWNDREIVEIALKQEPYVVTLLNDQMKENLKIA